MNHLAPLLCTGVEPSAGLHEAEGDSKLDGRVAKLRASTKAAMGAACGPRARVTSLRFAVQLIELAALVGSAEQYES